MQQRLNLRRIVVWGSAGAVLVAVVAALAQALLTRAAPMGMMLPNSLAPQVQGAMRGSALATDRPLTITFTLRSRNQGALEQFVRDVATPHSRHYHAYLTPAQFALAFGPDPAEVQRVQGWAQSQGLRVTQVRSGGIFISASGSVAQMQQAFGVQIAQYRDASGASFYANDRALRLPAAIAPGITSVTGLDNAAFRHHKAVGPRALPPHPGAPRPRDTTCPATTGTFGLTPPQLQTAYGFPTNLNGANQRIALVEFDGYQLSDIAVYAGCFAAGVNVGTVVQTRKVDLQNALTPGDGAVEANLDIEIALGMAPGLAKVDVYEAPNSNQGAVDLLAAIANDNLDATVSDSWGACEADTGYGAAAAEEMALLQMAAQGQGVYVAAGDTGAYNCLVGAPTYHGRILNADDPASDPYVTAVGGTTLSLNATTAGYMGETVWNSSGAGDAIGTGGGFSQLWASPSWQANARASSAPGGVSDPTGARVVPDIAADADPQTGYAMYCTVGAICAPLAGWFDIGGTSAAAPLWAALALLANQQAMGRVGLITPALYQLYGADTAAKTAAGVALGGTTYYDYQTQVNGAAAPGSGTIAFHDITQGNNTFPATEGFPVAYGAQTGYDAVSGLGSMLGQAIVSYLAGQVRFTAPRLYMAARGTDNGYYLAGYFLNAGNNNAVPDAFVATQWQWLSGQTFQGAPAIADNGLATASVSGNAGRVWIAGVGTDDTVRFGSWNPSLLQFSGWAAVPGTTCKGDAAAAYVQSTFFVTCETPTGAVVINAFNPAFGTWGGWATIGGGLTSPPTMATDGQVLLIAAQAPTGKGDQSDWFTFYTPGPGTRTPWYHFMTTCQATPSVAFAGSGAGTYLLGCVASDTHTLWANALTTSTNSLAQWINLGGPAGIGLKNGTAIAVDQLDSPNVLFYSGEGTNNATYIQVVTTNPYFNGVTGWQIASAPSLFSTAPSADYFGI